MKAKFYAEIIVAFMIGTGCATYGEIEKDFGKSYDLEKNGQISNPAASKNLKPVTGLSGKPAESSLKKYVESFGKPGAGQEAPNFVVPVMTPGAQYGTEK